MLMFRYDAHHSIEHCITTEGRLWTLLYGGSFVGLRHAVHLRVETLILQASYRSSLNDFICAIAGYNVSDSLLWVAGKNGFNVCALGVVWSVY